MAVVEQLLPAMPGRQAAEGIPADQQQQLDLGAQLGAQRFQGVDGPRRPVAPQLAVVHVQRRHIGHRQAHHVQTRLRADLRRAAVRRTRAGNQAQLVEGELLGHLQRGAQVADMDRIEGAAEQTNALGHQPRT
ncbi:hypothetical protein D3C81_1486760 [compost metagenome]